MKNKNEIKRYIKNEELDLEKIIDEFSCYVYKIIKNMAVLSDEDTEEIVSDTFFILWKNREKLDDEKLLSSYIAGIVRNLVKEKARVININVDISNYENVLQDCKEIDMICEQREKISIIEKTVKEIRIKVTKNMQAVPKSPIKNNAPMHRAENKINPVKFLVVCMPFKVDEPKNTKATFTSSEG